jgi:predicted dehydrogenase
VSRIRAALVGLGYWGPNLLRNLQANDRYELVAMCDSDPKRLNKCASQYPWAKPFSDFSQLLRETKPDLAVIATPVRSHYPLAIAALEAGCHVLCEKPLAESTEHATKIVETAHRMGRRLFVDHTFLYTSAVRFVRDQHAAGSLGDLFYVDSVRINLGLFQPDVDVVWDLAPHDLSIISHVIRQRVKSVTVNATSHNPRNHVDVAYLGLEYESGLTAHLHLSWLSPVKVRRMIFSGTRSSIIIDELEASEKVKIYDHGVTFDVSDLEARRQVLVSYRRGEMRAPALDQREALATELIDIAGALDGDTHASVATGEDGLEVVRTLDAIERSLAAGGARTTVER